MEPSLGITGNLRIQIDAGANIDLTFTGHRLVMDLSRLPTKPELELWKAALSRKAPDPPQTPAGQGTPGNNPAPMAPPAPPETSTMANSPGPPPIATSAPGTPRVPPDRGLSPRQKRREVIEGIDQGLRRIEMDVELRIAGAPVARMGPQAQPTLSAKILGLGPVELLGITAFAKWLGM